MIAGMEVFMTGLGSSILLAALVACGGDAGNEEVECDSNEIARDGECFPLADTSEGETGATGESGESGDTGTTEPVADGRCRDDLTFGEASSPFGAFEVESSRFSSTSLESSLRPTRATSPRRCFTPTPASGL